MIEILVHPKVDIAARNDEHPDPHQVRIRLMSFIGFDSQLVSCTLPDTVVAFVMVTNPTTTHD